MNHPRHELLLGFELVRIHFLLIIFLGEERLQENQELLDDLGVIKDLLELDHRLTYFHCDGLPILIGQIAHQLGVVLHRQNGESHGIQGLSQQLDKVLLDALILELVFGVVLLGAEFC